jgi:hypothetical protein
MSSKPETKKAVEEAREELKHADMEQFGRALRALVKIPATDLKSKPRKRRSA